MPSFPVGFFMVIVSLTLISPFLAAMGFTPMLFIIPAISEYYPDIAENNNKNIFTINILSYL